MTGFPARIGITPPAICKIKSFRENLLTTFPNAVFNETGKYFTEEDLIEFLKDADGVLIGRDPLTDKVLTSLPNLKIISKYGVGLDNIDQEAIKLHGRILGFTPGVNKHSVAELALGFMISLCHNIFKSGFALKNRKWEKDGGHQLSGKTVGIIGCGNVGKELIRLLRPFECRVLVRDILDLSEYCSSHGAEETSFEELITRSDIISLHVPLTKLTRNMIDGKILQNMKTSSFLINTSRGDIVNEVDLKQALMNDSIAGAALDVFSIEPPEDQDLLECENLMVTPHIGGNTVEAVTAMGNSALEHLVNFFKN
ncbi:MAG: phosphoglycerate dehydrogenase [Nitrospinales bacterium]